MDGAEARHGSNREPPSSKTEHISSAGNNQSGHYRPPYQSRMSGIRATGLTRINQSSLCNQYSTGRESQVVSVERRRCSQLNPTAESYIPEGTIVDSRDESAQSEISHQENFRKSM
jgi:hypothetical protein